MKTRILSMLFCVAFFLSKAQISENFKTGTVSQQDLALETYARDPNAPAVFLDEYGEAFVENGDNFNLIFRYYGRIKILSTEGLAYANIEIPLRKNGDRQERITDVSAYSHNSDNGVVSSTKVGVKDVFSVNENKYWNTKKIVIPDVRVGTVIEYYYEKSSPFIYNFHPWEFQAEIPKVKSTYKVRIPATYNYNALLRGYLKLSRNDQSIVKHCLGTGDGGPMSGGFSVDCSQFIYGMANIPAFKEEPYMTAKRNFVSAIHFELSEIRTLNGGINKITKEWKDAEDELRRHEKFGVALKRNGDELKEEISLVTANETNSLNKAKAVYDYVKNQFEWNGENEMFCEDLKKAIQNKRGSAAELNLFLVGALREQGLNADPVILSTRDHGQVTNLYAILTDFNYVIAHLNIDGTSYLLDATEPLLPFGSLPLRCLNGQGRLLATKEGGWVDLKTERSKHIVIVDAKLDSLGVMVGSIQSTFSGYEALQLRKRYFSLLKEEGGYRKSLETNLPNLEIKNVDVTQIEKLDQSLIRTISFESTVSLGGTKEMMISPYLLGKSFAENPFKSSTRSYPVDFGSPEETTLVFNLQFPESFKLANLPEKVGMRLPNGGGKFLVDAYLNGNRLTYTSSLHVDKGVYSAVEYHYLREMFNRLVKENDVTLLFHPK